VGTSVVVVVVCKKQGFSSTSSPDNGNSKDLGNVEFLTSNSCSQSLKKILSLLVTPVTTSLKLLLLFETNMQTLETWFKNPICFCNYIHNDDTTCIQWLIC
jgi:hypothetical protein